MSFRYMRIIVFFDLPVITVDERREYRKFRKYLISNGFMMLQESVYCKIELNAVSMQSTVNNIRLNKPPDGLVQVLKITEKQFAKMEFIVGNDNYDIINSDAKLVVLGRF